MEIKEDGEKDRIKTWRLQGERLKHDIDLLKKEISDLESSPNCSKPPNQL